MPKNNTKVIKKTSNVSSNKTKKVTQPTKSIKEPIEETNFSLSEEDTSDSESSSVENLPEEEENDKLSDEDMGVEDEDQESNSESDVDSDKDVDDECVYKYTKSSKVCNHEIDDDLDEEDTDIEKITDDNRYVKPEDRIGKPFLFKYEKVRLLQDRATQLASGSNPMIKNVSHLNPKQIAKLELETGKIPLYIERELPDGKIEIWYVPELKQNDREYIKDESS